MSKISNAARNRRASGARARGIAREKAPRNKSVADLLFRNRGRDWRGCFLQGDSLREVSEDHDVADALDPPVRHGHGAPAFHEERVRLTDEQSVDSPVLDINDQVVHIAQEHAGVRVDLEANDLRNLLKDAIAIPCPAYPDTVI